MSIHYIYILRCPQTNEIRYVGCTEHPKIRERNHCRHAVSNPNTRVLMWVKSLREQGMRPVFEIIESSERAFQHGRLGQNFQSARVRLAQCRIQS
jgi:hypothetical protein